MIATTSPINGPFFLATTSAFPCPYLTGRIARTQIVIAYAPIGPFQYEAFLAKGFCREGHELYAPYCSSCAACTAIRIPVAHLQMSRTQKRIWRKASQFLVAFRRSAGFDPEHFALYNRYLKARHPQSDRSAQSFAQLFSSRFDSVLIEFRTRFDHALKIGVLLDVLPDALAAIYSWFDPDEPYRSYGTFAILWLVALARTLGLRYLYLGYTIEGLNNMAYKMRFRPFERLEGGVWKRYE